MTKLKRGPSPALVVSVVALSFALAGSAIAGTDSLDRALTTGKVKKIAKKQANKAIKKAAPTLSVANANTANTATTAANGAAGYADFSATGVARAGALNMNNLTVSSLPAAPFFYCEDQAFKIAVGTGGLTDGGLAADVSAITNEDLAAFGFTPAMVGCPANMEWLYVTYDFTGGTAPASFRIVAH